MRKAVSNSFGAMHQFAMSQTVVIALVSGPVWVRLMTDPQEMPAGREMDAEVAVRVLGWQHRLTSFNNQQFVTVPPDWTDFSASRWLGHDVNELVPHYSTSIEAA